MFSTTLFSYFSEHGSDIQLFNKSSYCWWIRSLIQLLRKDVFIMQITNKCKKRDESRSHHMQFILISSGRTKSSNGRFGSYLFLLLPWVASSDFFNLLFCSWDSSIFLCFRSFLVAKIHDFYLFGLLWLPRYVMTCFVGLFWLQGPWMIINPLKLFFICNFKWQKWTQNDNKKPLNKGLFCFILEWQKPKNMEADCFRRSKQSNRSAG